MDHALGACSVHAGRLFALVTGTHAPFLCLSQLACFDFKTSFYIKFHSLGNLKTFVGKRSVVVFTGNSLA